MNSHTVIKHISGENAIGVKETVYSLLFQKAKVMLEDKKRCLASNLHSTVSEDCGCESTAEDAEQIDETWKSLKKTKANLDAIRKTGKRVAVQHGEGDTLYKVMKPKKAVKEEAEQIDESMAANAAAMVLSGLVAGGFGFVALNFLFDNAFTPSNLKIEYQNFVRRWKDKAEGNRMAKDGGEAMAKELRGLIEKLPKQNRSYLMGLVTRMQRSLKPNEAGKIDAQAAGEFAREVKDRMKKLKPVEEELTGNQKALDKNGNGKIDAQDFKMLRKGKKKDTTE